MFCSEDHLGTTVKMALCNRSQRAAISRKGFSVISLGTIDVTYLAIYGLGNES